VVGDLTRYALLRFNGHEMLTPILLHRAEDILEAPQSLVTKKIVNQATKTFEWRK